ncbi:MAG: PLP-dependent aminotransferase family protein, partial [Caulobacter sp.]
MSRSATKTEAIVRDVRGRIASRTLSPGQRLASVRACARTFGVAAATVVEAYDRLAAEGLIEARPGSGFYVSNVAPPAVGLGSLVSPKDRAIDPFWVSRASLDAPIEALKPGCGWLPTSWMPHEPLRRALRDAARAETSVLTDYGSTRGATELRRQLAQRFAGERLPVEPDQILLTGSGTQAVDLVCRYLLRPGDVVLLDDPGYFNFQALLRAHHVEAIGAPWTTSGPDLNAFEAALRDRRPRLYITNSALQNPTGVTLSLPSAHRVLSLCDQYGVIVVEDDILADLEPTPSPRLATLDGLDRVIRIGSFSKTLSASIRCGYIAARPDTIEGLTDLQVATSFGAPAPLATAVVGKVLASGAYRRHVVDLRDRLNISRQTTTDRLTSLGVSPWVIPRGGFHLWCRLPDGVDSADLARFCMERGVVLAPGNVFSVSGSAADFMRINTAQCSNP